MVWPDVIAAWMLAMVASSTWNAARDWATTPRRADAPPADDRAHERERDAKRRKILHGSSHQPRGSARNIVSSQVLDRSSWRTRYVSPSVASQFEVPVVGRQPGVDHLRDGDATVSKNQRAWRLLAAMACVALDANGEKPLFMHPVTIRP